MQVVTNVTGTPIAVVCVAAPVARMSAPVPALLMVQVMLSKALWMVICGGLAGSNAPVGGKTVSEAALVLLQLMVLLYDAKVPTLPGAIASSKVTTFPAATAALMATWLPVLAPVVVQSPVPAQVPVPDPTDVPAAFLMR